MKYFPTPVSEILHVNSGVLASWPKFRKMALEWRENLRKISSFREISDQESRTNVNAILDQLNSVERIENVITDHAVC